MVTRAESRLDRREIEGLNRRSTALLCGMRDYMDKRRKMEVDPPACSRNRARGACMCGRRRKRACDPLGAAIGARVQTSEEKDARGAKSTAPGRLRLAQPEGPAVGQVRGKTVREWTKEDVAGWLRRSAKRTGSSRSPLLSCSSGCYYQSSPGPARASLSRKRHGFLKAAIFSSAAIGDLT